MKDKDVQIGLIVKWFQSKYTFVVVEENKEITKAINQTEKVWVIRECDDENSFTHNVFATDIKPYEEYLEEQNSPPIKDWIFDKSECINYMCKDDHSFIDIAESSNTWMAQLDSMTLADAKRKYPQYEFNPDWFIEREANYCPICNEYIGFEPFCSNHGDVSGFKPEEYNKGAYVWMK